MTDWRIEVGDCRDVLASLPERSVHTVVTSPPYFGLRDYGTGTWEGGDPGCDHIRDVANRTRTPNSGGMSNTSPERRAELADAQPDASAGVVYHRESCPCGATRVDRQIGLEPTPDEFVAAMVAVFREIRRVLRDDGTVWLNLGDSYAGGGRGGHSDGILGTVPQGVGNAYPRSFAGCKPKDLIGVPWLVAFALRNDGWYLRSEIIWAKKNCMPESVTDRPTKSHEQIFLLSKSPRYYFDHDAVREGVPTLRGDASDDGVLSAPQPFGLGFDLQDMREGASQGMAGTGWSSEREGSGAALCTDGAREGEARRVSAVDDTQAADRRVSGEPRGTRGSTSSEPVGGGEGSPDTLLPHREGEGGDGAQARQTQDGAGLGRGNPDGRGVGGDHRGGAGAMRVLPEDGAADDGSCDPVEQGWAAYEGERGAGVPSVQRAQEGPRGGRNIRSVWHVATQPYAGAHFATFPPRLIEPCILAGAPEGGVVLDPFAGAGTTGLVALQHARSFVGIELNPVYAMMARDRISTAVRLGFRSPQSGDDVIPGQLAFEVQP